MTIKNAINLFESLKSQTQKKSELKIYKEFTEILIALEKREMTEVELQSLETFLSQLELTILPKNKRKYFRRKLRGFKEYLKKEFSLITKGYYATLGTGIGMTFGISIGAAFSNVGSGVSIGMMFGMFFGMIVGRYMDSEAEKANRVLKTTIK
mgnify:CR=1 FL=1